MSSLFVDQRSRWLRRPTKHGQIFLSIPTSDTVVSEVKHAPLATRIVSMSRRAFCTYITWVLPLFKTALRSAILNNWLNPFRAASNVVAKEKAWTLPIPYCYERNMLEVDSLAVGTSEEIRCSKWGAFRGLISSFQYIFCWDLRITLRLWIHDEVRSDKMRPPTGWSGSEVETCHCSRRCVELHSWFFAFDATFYTKIPRSFPNNITQQVPSFSPC